MNDLFEPRQQVGLESIDEEFEFNTHFTTEEEKSPQKTSLEKHPSMNRNSLTIPDIPSEVSSEEADSDTMFATLKLSTGNEKLLKQGYCYYCLKSIKSWRKRWIVLRNNRVFIYKDEREYRAKHIISLADCKKIVSITIKKFPYTIQIETLKHTYYFAMESSEERSDWLLSFSSHT